MRTHIQDRWYRPAPGGGRARTRRHDARPRYRAHLLAQDSHRTKDFRTLRDAQRWLARTQTAYLAGKHT